METYCVENCTSYLQAPQFLQDDGSSNFIFNRVDEFSLPTQKNFELSEGQILAGTVSLPDGQVADSGTIGNWVLVARYSDSGQYVDQFSNYVEIQNGDNSADYQVSYLSVIPGGSYLVRSYCVDNCGNYVEDSQYLQTDGTISFKWEAGLSDDDIPEELDFELVIAQKLIGTVSLPNSDVASVDIGVLTQIRVYDAAGDFLSTDSSSQTIQTGTSSINFEIPYIAAPASGSYSVVNRCQTNCGGYLQFVDSKLQEDGTTSPAGGFDLRVSNVPEIVEFELLATEELTGKVSLPSGLIADSGDISVEVFMSTFDSQGNFISSNSFSGVIANGESFADFSMSYFPAPIGGSYTLSSRCTNNCGDLVLSVVYLQEDGSTDFGLQNIPEAVFPAMPNIELIEGVSIMVRTLLPTSITADANMQAADTYAVVQAHDADGNVFGSGFVYLDYVPGASTSDFARVVAPEIDAGQYYKIIYTCSDIFDGDCGVLLDSILGYSTSNIATGIAFADELTELPTSADLQLYRGTSASFELSRPDNQPDFNQRVYFEVNILAYNENDELIGQDAPSLSLNANLSSSVLNYGLLDVPEGGYYEINYSCTDQFVYLGGVSDCSFYSPSDPSYSFVVPANAIPNPMLLKLVGLIQPDSYEVDNQFQLANTITSGVKQQHTIHEAGDKDWLKFSIQTPSDVKIEVVSQGGSDGAARVSLFESDAVTLIQDNDDILEDEELSNPQLSLINIQNLAAGNYFILIEGFSDTSTSEGYTVTYTGPDDEFCFPIVAKNGAVALICL